MPGKEIKEKELIAPVGFELYVINTGDWRTHRPVMDKELCNDCGLCALYCPTSSVKLLQGEYRLDLAYCKGCGICRWACVHKAISMVEEGVNLLEENAAG